MDIRDGKVQLFECPDCWVLLPYQGCWHSCPDGDDEVASNLEDGEWLRVMSLILRARTFRIEIHSLEDPLEDSLEDPLEDSLEDPLEDSLEDSLED